MPYAAIHYDVTNNLKGLENTSKRESKCKKTAYVRDVRVGSEPLFVLASKRQNDLKRFCCYEREFKPHTVEPTFNIGRFNVTPISYQHLALENKNGGKHPTFIGPMLIHEKTEETYSTFCASLKSLEPELANLIALGTDDEEALEKAFNNNFEKHSNAQLEVVRKLFNLNGFPSHMFDHLVRRFLDNMFDHKPTVYTVPKIIVYFCLPFTGSHSFQIRNQITRLCNVALSTS